MSASPEVSPSEYLEPVLPIPPDRRRSIVRRLFGPVCLLAIVALFFGLWFNLHRHLMGMAAISLRGGSVHWDLSAGKWKHGGESMLSYGMQSWNANEDSFTPVVDLNHVISLDLSNAAKLKTEDYGLLRRLPDLRLLYLSHHDIPGYPQPSVVTDGVMPDISGHEELAELYLDGNPITDSGLVNLADLPKLEVIDLTRTGVTDAGLMHLLAFPSLKTVHVDEEKITDAGITAFAKRRPEVEIIRDDPKARANPYGY